MKILVGETEIPVVNCYAYRYPTGRLVLNIDVIYDVISHDALRAIFVDNSSDIVLTKDDGKTETFTGFYHQVKVSDNVRETDGTEIHSCEIECVSESEFQLGILQRKVQEQDATIAANNATIEKQNQEIQALNDTLLETIMG